jgi:nucleoside-diphosphate kinase
MKPHVLRAHKTGEVLQAVQDAGFDIFALFSIHLTIPMAHELFDVYRGIATDYSTMIDSMCAGPVLALAVTLPGCDDGYEVVARLREFTGPVNPALAKVLRPESLRARFGENQLLNGVHCTDLPEDGEMECKYFFETLANL